MNPQIANITQIIFLIQLQRYPQDYVNFNGITSHEQFVSDILTKLLHKEYIRIKIRETRPESEMIDLSNPAEWFPEARKMKRKIIMHVGPTNSGKTYSSLQTLKNAKSGYYAGPLRLLAREIYERFNQENTKCNLITGEEVIPSVDEFGKLSEISSGTIEMIPLHKKMDICVIDEIQMIADENRGAAWTNAVLGVLAKELHLCGEESAVPLIEKITKFTGDELVIKKYERLGKLSVLPTALQDVKNLQKGDCLIAFSKRKILELKCKIEQSTKLKVGIIYGALPPEIRSQEANGFNEGKYDVLVASDAVGMGLNLRIKRIIFHGVKKFNGNEMKPLTVSAVKQIAGRAGRFSKDKGELEGFVTSYMKRDLDFIKTMMESPTKNLNKACIWPTDLVWKHYMAKFPKDVPFHKILHQFELETKSLNMKNYFISDLDSRNEMLKMFLREDLYKRTTIEDQLKLSLAPINVLMNSPEVIETAFKFLRNITVCATNNVFDFDFLHEPIIRRTPKVNTTIADTVETLRLLEDNHRVVLLFLWLSQRWPTLFVDKEGAMDIKSLIEKRISQELNNLRRLNKTG
ncbi:P-loop containing nucleoside triphosphate hydrolase protein [Suhomyces tanzawaensis NRRL Y-17324]|uniref:ATP-dependent RNA helicase SUV3, mitochondrial n=1 Tax=Suhomyces tanzawaensis NRRL Y-17324 TaxID=984487 RepID=A0A1E4SJX3_9ASCO|nr:P-loop containing nucleoside triphosphate hydrolase protein [Suhomyces tanzawaensis NRRL Y-17324]ODV79803.1 P-loop containing nucleoside triphosphate hydrolase protein [Suhomyces tanzawaensis NRRL Y-17324]